MALNPGLAAAVICSALVAALWTAGAHRRVARRRVDPALSRPAAGAPGRAGAGERRAGTDRPAVVARPSRSRRPGLLAMPARVLGELRGRRPRRREAQAAAEAVTELLGALALELRAGRSPGAALESAAALLPGPPLPGLTRAVAAASVGTDVATALRAAADDPGASGLRALAACWAATSSTGGGLAAAVDRLAEAGRAERAHRDEVRAALAGPRATARVLAVLPLVGVGLGQLLGADPVHVLTTSPLGLGLLAGAVVFDAAGLAWTAAIVRRAEAAG